MDFDYGPGRDLLVDGCIVLHGMVGGDFWDEGFTSTDVIRALATLGRNADVTVRINSGGGIATEGSAIHAILSAHKGRVTTVVEGIAASAASIIAMAGDERVMAMGALMMIHDPSGLTMGTAEDHLDTAQALEVIAASMASIYAEATKRPVEEIRAEMSAETWLTAEEAIAKGYSDRVGAANDDEPAPFPFRSYAHAPERFVAMADARGWSGRKPVTASQKAPARADGFWNEMEVGDKVTILSPHDPAHNTGTIQLVSGETPYGVLIDGMEEMGIHRWYTTEELEYAGSDAVDDDTVTAGRRKKKPMRPMKMVTQSLTASSASSTHPKKEAPMPGSNTTATGTPPVANASDNIVQLDEARAAGRAEALATALPRAQAAEIATLCAAGGLTEMTASLLAEGVTVEQAKARITAAGQIKDLVALARRSNPEIPETFASTMLAEGKTVDQARAALFDKMVAREDETAVTTHHTAAPQASAGPDAAKANMRAQLERNGMLKKGA
jgi:ATP-dependent protease ClpP protease subunit